MEKTTEEDEARQLHFDNMYNPLQRKSRNNRNGGSLQDLQDALNSDQFGNNYQTNYGTMNASGRPNSTQSGKKHSKRKQSSVSSRQREGGSLPNDVNKIDQFLSECRSNHKRSIKGDGKFADKLTSQSPHHTIIDMMEGDPVERQHLLAYDSLGQQVIT